MPQIILETFNLEAAERRLCVEALGLAGNIVGAAQILGITRHAMKRRIVKLGIDRSRPSAPTTVATMTPMTPMAPMATMTPMATMATAAP